MQRSPWGTLCLLPDPLVPQALFGELHPLNHAALAATLAPCLQTLSKDGYLYDATLVEWYYPNSPTSPSKDQVLWPCKRSTGSAGLLLGCLQGCV